LEQVDKTGRNHIQIWTSSTTGSCQTFFLLFRNIVEFFLLFRNIVEFFLHEYSLLQEKKIFRA
jgi:hypothetical protein